jgi:hypothetical protein
VAINGLQEASDGALVLAIARYHQEALAEAYRRHAGPCSPWPADSWPSSR